MLARISRTNPSIFDDFSLNLLVNNLRKTRSRLHRIWFRPTVCGRVQLNINKMITVRIIINPDFCQTIVGKNTALNRSKFQHSIIAFKRQKNSAIKTT